MYDRRNFVVSEKKNVEKNERGLGAELKKEKINILQKKKKSLRCVMKKERAYVK